LRPFIPKSVFPKRRAYAELCDQLIAYLLEENPEVGESFFTAKQLAETTGLSYMTVRRALDELNRQGWLNGRAGKGTFVGSRVKMPVVPRRTRKNEAQSIVRLAVMSQSDWPAGHWLIHEFLEGLETAAHDLAISVELLSDYRGDRDAIRNRLAQTRPDVVVSVVPDDGQIRIIGEAERLGIPCIVAVERWPQLGLPNVYEDGLQGSGLAVRKLVKEGHRRIAYTSFKSPEWHIFDRRDGFLASIEEAGIEPDENMIFWFRMVEDRSTRAMDIKTFIKKRKPTAVVLGSCGHAETVGQFIREDGLEIPRDLSIVTYDQAPLAEEALGMKPTQIVLPLHEIGLRIAEMARDLAEGKDVTKDVPIPCTLNEGDTVAENRTADGRELTLIGGRLSGALPVEPAPARLDPQPSRY
jgi:DNA-binding LacI/PurR family transcriptional regulator